MGDTDESVSSKDPKTPSELVAILTKYEDAESAILVYKEIGATIKEYEAVKAMAMSCAEKDLRVGGERKRITNTGSCGWTKPTKLALDKDLWEHEKLEHPVCSGAEEAVARSKANLAQLQEEHGCMTLPPGRFYIR